MNETYESGDKIEVNVPVPAPAEDAAGDEWWQGIPGITVFDPDTGEVLNG